MKVTESDLAFLEKCKVLDAGLRMGGLAEYGVNSLLDLPDRIGEVILRWRHDIEEQEKRFAKERDSHRYVVEKYEKQVSYLMQAATQAKLYGPQPPIIVRADGKAPRFKDGKF
jgi:hypothetical protein